MGPENGSLVRRFTEKKEEENVALIFGVTGLVGREIAKMLSMSTKPRWRIYGVARKPEINPATTTTKKMMMMMMSYSFISCDLLNASETKQKLSPLQDTVSHVFWVTWSGEYPLDSDECCVQNKTMLANALDAILPNAKRLKHFSLQTGMKHYVSLSGGEETRSSLCCYYSEECPRRGDSGKNFYYALEDLLKEKISGNSVVWSVQRPGLLMGSSTRTLYNFIGSLSVYGAICKYLNLPFVFGGTRECWDESYIDGSDSNLVAEQHIFAATSGRVRDKGEAFNAINGVGFTWKEIWPEIGRKLGVQVKEEKEMFDEGFWFEREMSGRKHVWDEIVVKERLVGTEIEDLANWVFLDVLFRCPFKLLGKREKVDRFGFKRKYRTLDSILYWIDVMRDQNLIPL